MPLPNSGDNASAEALASGYKSARLDYLTRQFVPWIPSSAEVVISGYKPGPLTLRHWLILELAGNAVLYTANPGNDDLAQYVAVVSGSEPDREFCKRIARALDDPEDSLSTWILEHRADAFEDSAVNLKASKSKNSTDVATPPAPDQVIIAELVASNYGQDPDIVMDWPVRKCLQLLRCWQARTNPNYQAAAPEYLNRILADYVKATSKEKEAANGAA